jgi:hypothetical protein
MNNNMEDGQVTAEASADAVDSRVRGGAKRRAVTFCSQKNCGLFGTLYERNYNGNY